MRRFLLWPLCSSLLLLGCSSDGVQLPRTNVILISLDSTRADYVGAYEASPSPLLAGKSATPHLDRLASEGVVFENALATTVWTMPSHVALFTGHPDLVHAAELDGNGVHPTHTTLAERLQELGYRTAGFYSGPYLDPRHGFDRGFDRYVACYGELLERSVNQVRAARAELATAAASGDADAHLLAWERVSAAQRALERRSQSDVSSRNVIDAALGELADASKGPEPFFLFVHLFDPHYDYVPPPPYDELFDPGYDGSIDGHDFYRNPAVSTFDASAPSGRVRTVSERDLEHLRALYAGDIAATDHQVGRMLAYLDDHGLTQDTLIAVVSDHGDEFFEHGGIGHRRTLFEEALRVPILLRFPAAVPAGGRIGEVVSTADVMPTILGLLGIPGGESTGFDLGPGLRGSGLERPGVLSRLVRSLPATLEIEIGGRPEAVPVDQVQVFEAFRSGSIKVTRQRNWFAPQADTAAELLPALLADSARRKEQEALRWIDLALHPDEKEEDHSTDFSDAAARTALEAFRERYRLLAKQRVTARKTDEAQELAAALRGLGYGGEEAELVSDDLLLPLPGEE